MLVLICWLPLSQAQAETLTIDSAKWDSARARLILSGKGTNAATVSAVNAYDQTQGLGSATVRKGKWKITSSRPSSVPCRVRATQSDGQTVERDVTNRPDSCTPSGVVTNQPPTANAGPDQTFTLAVSQTSTAVTLTGSGSSDPDGSIASYNWTGTPDPANTMSPSVTLAAGSYTFSLVVTDNGGLSSAVDSVRITVNAAPNQAPTANAGADQTLNLAAGQTSTAVTLNGSGSSDPDGSIASYNWIGSPDPADTVSPSVTLAAGTYTFTLVVTDNAGASSSPDTVRVTVSSAPTPVACNPVPADAATAHIQCITAYTGPEVCVACHMDEARAMHGSVHYQQNGPSDFVTNIDGFAGERGFEFAATGINTYCGTHENSPRFTCAGCHVGNGRFPMPQSQFELLPADSAEAKTQLANIDCLMCHQQVYKRFPDWTGKGYGFVDLVLQNVATDGSGHLIPSDYDQVTRTGYVGIPKVDPVTGDFQFLPAGIDNLPVDVPMAPMAVSTLAAAQTVHATTRQSCLNCHAGAAGADGAKRGDLSKELANTANTALDYHMSTHGGDMSCSQCHDAGGHRVRGRGLDLRPNDVAERFTCDSAGCHSSQPHPSTTTGNRLNRHAAKVACQTCHIPKYAKAAAGTEVARDWQDPHPTDTACNGRGGWLPREDKGYNLTPSYTWFDGKSDVYYLGEPLNGVPTLPVTASIATGFGLPANEPAYVLGVPTAILDASGAINQRIGAASSAAKLYPMKEHWGKLASDGETLIGHSTFEFFRTGSFCRATAVGLGLDEVNQPQSNVCNGLPGDPEMPPGTEVVAVHTFQTINHGVEPKGNALGANNQCGVCHNTPSLAGGPARMDLEGVLGYALRSDIRLPTGPSSNGTWTCSVSCHETKSANFTKVHEIEKHRSRGCKACHSQIANR